MLPVWFSACTFFSLLAQNAQAAHLDPSSGVNALNKSLHGRVQRLKPFALPCFSTFEGKHVQRQDALCEERQANYLNPLYRREIPGAYMYDTSSINASDPSSRDQCLLDVNDPFNPEAWTGRDCKLGNLPSHYIDVKNACDAVKAFKSARKYGLKLSIKNSGHTYMEDASGAESLLLWTRNLQRLRHDASFVPSKCPAQESYNTITTGAGVSCGEAYEFADKHNVTILCGYSPTVGLSGGWVMAGGHSVLTNVYGMGVDRVMQFRVVTPDGKIRTANKCQNQDLFWALRGGGGGTFGLVLDSTHRVEPQMPLAVASIGIPADDSKKLKGFMDLLVDTAIQLAKDGWGGHIYGTYIVYVNPKITSIREAKKSMRKISQFAEAQGGSSNITSSPTWYKFFQDFVLSGTYAVGNLQFIGTQLAPAKLFTDEHHKTKLKSFFHSEIAKGNIPYIPVDSPYLARGTAKPSQTSMNPAWYDSLWEIGIGGAFKWNGTLEERLAVVEELQRGTNSLEELTLGGAAYKNEANPFTNNWKDAWYGGNYDALLRIKQKYDPDSLLRCWGCVGWTPEDAERSSYRAFVNVTGL